MINTVTGTITPAQLGKTLMHEHIIFGYPGYQGDTTMAPWNANEALANVTVHIEAAQAHGVSTIVDATPNECGRDPGFLKRVSEATGMQIICSTGFYYEGEGGAAYFKMRSQVADIAAEIYEMMMTEINVGITGTGIKAGVIKLASSKDQLTDYEKVFFHVGAKVSQETGVPIITHTQEGTMGPDQAELLISLGTDPGKIMIGHMCGNRDIAYQLKTLEQGVNVSFDRCGLQVMLGAPMDSERISLFGQLIDKGYAKHLNLSQDFICHWLGRPVVIPDEIASILANYHLTNVFENIIPGLLAGGASQEEIDQIMIGNPIALFS